MPISIKLKKRWDIYPTLQDVLTATQNLSVSPFGTTLDDELQDFRGIKLIGTSQNLTESHTQMIYRLNIQKRQH
ncbi:hypothetical protein RCZ04_09500 [Capnocytophaga sp. HP1101]